MSESSKESVLARWRKRQASQSKTNDSEKVLALSGDQLRLWFLQKLSPGNPFYHYAELYRIEGELDRQKFERSLVEISKRHDVLRTLFPEENGKPRAKIIEETHVEINRHQLSSELDDSEIERLSVEEARKPFDLAKGPLWRVAFFEDGNRITHILFTMHHIITDKWSMQIIRDEIAVFYRGEGESLEPVRMGFQEFAGKIRDDDPKIIEYWKQRLDDAPDFLPIPTDFPRPITPSYNGRFLSAPLGQELSLRITEYCREHSTTPYVFLLSIYQILLSRISGLDRIAVGSPLTSRASVETERMVGFFDHTMVLLGEIDKAESFLDFLKKNIGVRREAVDNRDVRLDSILNAVNRPRTLTHNPLFQVMFIFHQVPLNPDFGDGVTLSYEPLDFHVAKFDLTLFVSESSKGLTPIFEYSTDLFSEDRINVYAEQFRNLIEFFLEDETKCIGSAFKALGSEEETIEEFANPGNSAEYQSVIRQISENFKNNGESPALKFGDETLTYSELDEWSGRIAAVVAERKAKVIGIELTRGWKPIASMIGVLRAGACYVPIDPTLPENRLSEHYSSAGVDLIIRESTGGRGPSEILFDSIPSADWTDIDIDDASTAYIIQTSGSSGKPKSVEVSHRNLNTSNSARYSFYEDHPGTFLLLSALTFDSSVAGIYWTLSNGGTLVVSEERIEQDMDRLAECFKANEVTHTLLLPSLYESLLRSISINELKSLRVVIAAGEALTSGICELHFSTVGGTRLYNEYGPTEATVWATGFEVPSEREFSHVPIGKPIPGYKVFILNENAEPVPIGVAGELVIGGGGVAAYRNADSDSFSESPFDSGEQIYRTGDECRWNPDGTIEFLGRIDGQLKLRGYRIEPGEIDFHIKEMPGIEDSLTFVWESGHRSKDEIHDLIENVGVGVADELLQKVLREEVK